MTPKHSAPKADAIQIWRDFGYFPDAFHHGLRSHSDARSRSYDRTRDAGVREKLAQGMSRRRARRNCSSSAKSWDTWLKWASLMEIE